MKPEHILLCFLGVILMSGCTLLPATIQATPLPTGYLLTAAVKTLKARNTLPSKANSPIPPSATEAATATATNPAPTSTTPVPPSETPSVPPPQPTDTPNPLVATLQATLALPITDTPMPAIPEARVQIYQLGELSLVTSPIEVIARLTSQVGKVVRIELHGEDGRLLARQVRTYNTIPWKVAKIGERMPFEIRAAAELGRLVISVEDIFGRLIDVNSVNLILLSKGMTELNPATALWQIIYIQEPTPQALIQGGTVYVTGLAKPNTNDPLRLALITEEGRVVGQRLAAVNIPHPGGYGVFTAEVPYTVSGLTPVLLVVYESGGVLSEIAHLSSVEILLSP